jgi:hypothetical protein
LRTHAAFDYLFAGFVKLGNVKRTDLNARPAPDAGIRAVEHGTIFALGKGIDRAILDALRVDAVHAALVIEPVIVGGHEGPKKALAGLVVISEFLHAPVRTGVACRTVGVVKQNRIFFHGLSPAFKLS